MRTSSFNRIRHNIQNDIENENVGECKEEETLLIDLIRSRNKQDKDCVSRMMRIICAALFILVILIIH